MKRAVFRRLYEDTPGGKYARRVGQQRWQTIEWTDMDDACGRDNDGHPRYHVELAEVDLLCLPDSARAQALASCGFDLETIDPKHREVALVEALHDYGSRAPLGSWSGNNLGRLMREARQRAAEIEDDPDEHEAALNRVVNQMGATALEYAQGDLYASRNRNRGTVFSASLRKVPSDDPIAYCAGFSRGLSGAGLETDFREQMAIAYVQGYQFGVEVRIGKAAKPEWVR